MAATGGPRRAAGGLQRLPHLEPPRPLRRHVHDAGPANDGADPPPVATTLVFVAWWSPGDGYADAALINSST